MNALLLLLLACEPDPNLLPQAADDAYDTGAAGLEVIPFCQLHLALEDASAQRPVADADLALFADGVLQDEALSEEDGAGTLFLGEHLLGAELLVEVDHAEYRPLALGDEALDDWRGDHSVAVELRLEPQP